MFTEVVFALFRWTLSCLIVTDFQANIQLNGFTLCDDHVVSTISVFLDQERYYPVLSLSILLLYHSATKFI